MLKNHQSDPKNMASGRVVTLPRVTVYLLLLAVALLLCEGLAMNGALARLLVSAEPPVPEAILKASAETTRERYPGADAVVVEYKIFGGGTKDGCAYSSAHEYIKILTEEGRRKNEFLTYQVVSNNETISISRARVIKPNGQWTEIDPEASSFNRLDDEGVQIGLDIHMAGLAAGDLVWVQSFRHSKSEADPCEWCSGRVTKRIYPVRHLSYHLYVHGNRLMSSAIPVPSVLTGFSYSVERPYNGTSVYKWELANIP